MEAGPFASRCQALSRPIRRSLPISRGTRFLFKGSQHKSLAVFEHMPPPWPACGSAKSASTRYSEPLPPLFAVKDALSPHS